MSFLGDAFAGRLRRGWYRRGPGRDQVETARDHEMDRTTVLARDYEPSRTLMPDRPEKPEVHWRDRERKPLVPEAYKRDHIRYALEHAKWWAKFHLYRLPLYLAQNMAWSFRGVSRLAAGLVHWARIQDERERVWEADAQARRGEESWSTVERMDRSRRDRARFRTAGVVLGVPVTAVLIFLRLMDHPWTVVPGVLVLVLGLGWTGRPRDRPWIENATVTEPKARKVTPDMIIKALHAAKLCKETVGDDAPEFVAPGVHRDGKGFAAIVDMPFGVTAQQAIDRKTQVAAGLRVDEFRLFIDQVRGDGGHAGRVKLWIADSDPYSRPPVPSPLVEAKKWSLWNEVPRGINERGDVVSVLMMWTSFLIGALPRMGKTTALRNYLCAAALDIHARLILFDGKGGKDLSPFERVAHVFGAGADDPIAKALLSTLRDLVEEMRRRFNTLRKQDPDVCPDGRLTPGISRNLDMPVIVLAIDEFQLYLESRYGDEMQLLLKTLCQVGPAAGIITLLSTQRPSGSLMKTDLRDSIGTREALRSATRESSEMILGTGSYKAGWDATKFLANHKGVSVLLGADDGPLADKGGQTLHGFEIDVAQATAICERARGLREGAGTLSGVAAGEQDELVSDQILEHVNRAFRGEEKAHSDVLCARLAEDLPGLYELWDQTDLADALRRHDISAGNQTWAMSIEGDVKRNRKGFERRQIIDKLAERAGEVPDSPPDDLD